MFYAEYKHTTVIKLYFDKVKPDGMCLKIVIRQAATRGKIVGGIGLNGMSTRHR